MIEFRHVGKKYPDGTVAIEDLSFDVAQGKITVLVGPSGCGKTTSLRMINRLVEPTSGGVYIDGRDVQREDPQELRRSIGYVIQDGGLFPHRTVADNVSAVPVLCGVKKKTARRAALDLLDTVGLDRSFASRYPWQLSGGQQQRVGIARALAADPPYLLMDEPFSALDPVVRGQLQDQLLAIQAEFAKTIVLVTHNVGEALKLGDQIVILDTGGTLMECGSPEHIIAEPSSAFVAGFLGASRGYESLGFVGGDTIDPRPVDPVHLGETLATGASGWVLVVDDKGAFLGWFDAAKGPAVTRDAINWSCAPALRTSTLKDHMDSVLSSPARLGVVTDEQSRVIGVIGLQDVLSALDPTVRG